MNPEKHISHDYIKVLAHIESNQSNYFMYL